MQILVNRKIKRLIAVAALEAFFLVFFSLQSSFFTGCATTVEYQPLHDTTIHHDTVSGPAFIRFLAMLNNSKASNIVFLKMNGPQDPALFTDVNPQMGKQFIPIPRDSSFVLYASYFYGTGTQKSDSVTIPRFGPYSLHTIVLFRTNDAVDPNRIFPIFADDSVRRLIAPKDSCYIRLINGLADYPQPTPQVNMYIDDINGSPFFKDKATGIASPVSFQEIRNYALMPAGSHQIILRSQADADPAHAFSAIQQFIPGEFYTIRLIGMKSDNTAAMNIDAE